MSKNNYAGELKANDVLEVYLGHTQRYTALIKSVESNRALFVEGFPNGGYESYHEAVRSGPNKPWKLKNNTAALVYRAGESTAEEVREEFAHAAVLRYRDVEVRRPYSGGTYLELTTPGAKQRFWQKGSYRELHAYLKELEVTNVT